jgi:hypothetical protein
MRGYLKSAASLFIVAAMMAPGAEAFSQETASEAEPARKLVEIYRIAPGRHEAFLRQIALFDKANEMAGLPPRELYVHSDGANWDFMLIQPASTPPEKAEALSAAWKELGLPSGANFFLTFRENIAEHTDTFVRGPTTARAFLASAEREQE